MKTKAIETSLDLQFTQIAWVVKDIKAAESFFRKVMGMTNFSDPQVIRAKEFDATYYGKPTDGETLVSIAYTGGVFVEIIQPISGSNIFQDYLEQNPAGGVQHIAYSVPIADFEKVISEFTLNGFPMISTYDTPIAKIVFFDTFSKIGVATEIMGITEAGEEVVKKMKLG